MKRVFQLKTKKGNENEIFSKRLYISRWEVNSIAEDFILFKTFLLLYGVKL